MSRWLCLGSALCLALGLAGCGGFSEEDAKARCDQERDSRNGGGTSCVDDVSYESCVTSYEECGNDAVVDDTSCPVHYSCDDADLEQEEG